MSDSREWPDGWTKKDIAAMADQQRALVKEYAARIKELERVAEAASAIVNTVESNVGIRWLDTEMETLRAALALAPAPAQPRPTSPPASPPCAKCGYPENSLAHSLTFGTSNGNHAFARPTSPPAEPTCPERHFVPNTNSAHSRKRYLLRRGERMACGCGPWPGPAPVEGEE